MLTNMTPTEKIYIFFLGSPAHVQHGCLQKLKVGEFGPHASLPAYSEVPSRPRLVVLSLVVVVVITDNYFGGDNFAVRDKFPECLHVSYTHAIRAHSNSIPHQFNDDVGHAGFYCLGIGIIQRHAKISDWLAYQRDEMTSIKDGGF